LGRLLLEGDDYKGATSAFERALSLDETRTAIWNNFGIALKGLERWQHALFAFDRALDCDPFNTYAMVSCADALRHLNQRKEAIARLKRAAKIDPDAWDIWSALATVYLDVRDKKNVLECLRKARSLAPDRHHSRIDARIENARRLPDEPSGAALMHSDPIAARKRLVAELRQNPRDVHAWHNLGQVLINAGEHVEARECFCRVLELDENNRHAISCVIELSGLLKDLQGVDHWCSVFAQMPKGAIPAIAFRARALVLCDKYNDARELTLEAVRRHPDEPDILIACGDVMMNDPTVSSTAMSNATAAYKRAVDILKRGIDIARLRETEGRLKQAQESLLQCNRDAGVA
jgi:tetratricopeptide (TPR) repeat protein